MFNARIRLLTLKGLWLRITYGLYHLPTAKPMPLETKLFVCFSSIRICKVMKLTYYSIIINKIEQVGNQWIKGSMKKMCFYSNLNMMLEKWLILCKTGNIPFGKIIIWTESWWEFWIEQQYNTKHALFMGMHKCYHRTVWFMWNVSLKTQQYFLSWQ